ncbi:MAG: hypothetical protein OXG87_24005 [Gemmatimonadetes bacterium]|nr:hypothetical protein [Gemmatimonadota bacterium]
MKRWLLCFALLALYTGCGSSNPVTPAPEPSAEETYDHVTADEADAYVADIHRVFTSIDVFLWEYSGVTTETINNLIPLYWSRQFLSNIIARIHAIQSTLHDMRPTNPYLLRLHIEEFEAAFVDYLDGVTFLQQNIDFITPEVINGLNMRMGAGNVHIIRLQIFLRDLTGLPVNFGGSLPGDGQTFGGEVAGKNEHKTKRQ